MSKHLKPFNGTGDVEVFIEKLTLHASLKGYDDEKTAQLF